MTYNTYRAHPVWHQARVPYQGEPITCPRCHNETRYVLVWDADEFGFPGLLAFKYNKRYALKCPICPNFELLSKEVATAILKGGA